MTLQTPLFMQAATGDSAVSYSAASYRYGLLASLFPVSGVIDPINSAGLQVVQHAAGANMSVDVNAGVAIVPGTDVSLQGTYYCANDAGGVNLTVPAAPGSGTRVHRVVAQVQDHLNNAGYAANTYAWALQLLADTGSGTPATPASAISLATVSVSAGQSSVTSANITDLRAWARPAISMTGLLTGNGWTWPDATRPGYWRLTADGFVELYGWAQPSTAFTATANAQNIMVSGLPSYVTPSGNRDNVGACSVTGFCRFLTQNNGNIYMIMPTTQNFATTDWVSLDGAKFKVTA